MNRPYSATRAFFDEADAGSSKNAAKSDVESRIRSPRDRILLDRGGGRPEVGHRQGGADALGSAVLEPDRGVDPVARAAGVDRRDEVVVLLVDDAAADLAGAGQLAVV